MLKRIAFGSALVAISALLMTSCGGSKEKNDNGQQGGETGAKAAYQSAGDEGTIAGKIIFNGTAPAPKTLNYDADPVCVSAATNKMTDDVMVKDGKLANVFIYIKSGGAVDKYTFSPSGEPQIDQKGCRYAPHVFGAMTKQNIKIVNSDNTTHNIHFTPTKNDDWNQSEPPGSPPKDKSFARTEVMISVKCNVHPWMKAYVGVLPHPFFAVSKEDGSYTIANVPPGEYTVVAWHEKYGEQTQKITVGAKESKTQDFTFSATSANASPSRKVGPAVVLP